MEIRRKDTISAHSERLLHEMQVIDRRKDADSKRLLLEIQVLDKEKEKIQLQIDYQSKHSLTRSIFLNLIFFRRSLEFIFISKVQEA